ncbi:helix-turn-helix domain-containing protein [Sandaracinus amylolyticus]|uniref:helix-turn-helix domain-containing protein n=1 Tax=Sandaracinus amylolyticus TaxID=927083 RepID=UPI001F452FF5|nr:helix-turn-helix transcriptional regulator [Sandaracinus amylolyticus]UJR79864.1 Hypothetical protein I5071_19030 [Sandaracinus amylolyticus]
MASNREKLRAFLSTRGMTTAAFAERVGVRHAATVSLWTTGARTPGLATAARIELATGGFVRAIDWAVAVDQGPQAA